ncbi:hypothetical protein BJ912DRAFT_1061447 [Pholiota molesta]|nr:hypothetical protein BJ912DRAFT_1061447 [Pholiota molesta]
MPWDSAHGYGATEYRLDKTGNAGAIKDLWRPADVAASMLVDLIASSTREKNGG